MPGLLDSSDDEGPSNIVMQPERHTVQLPADLQASPGSLLSLGTSNAEIYVGLLSCFLIVRAWHAGPGGGVPKDFESVVPACSPPIFCSAILKEGTTETHPCC